MTEIGDLTAHIVPPTGAESAPRPAVRALLLRHDGARRHEVLDDVTTLDDVTMLYDVMALHDMAILLRDPAA
ncbi:hypothetical protein ACWEKM_16965 [Streptomyces sp. NPDC004752]